MKRTLTMGAAAAPFAHLLGGLTGKRAGKAAAEDEKDKDALRAEDDDEEKDAKAEDPDEEKDARAEDDDEEKDAKKSKKSKKAKAEDEDDDEAKAESDDDDEEEAAARAEGRKAERARCRKIFSSKAAGIRPDVAAQLAFATDLTSAEAIGVLEATAAGQPPLAAGVSRLHQRMARVQVPSLAEDAHEQPKLSGAAAQAKAIAAAAAKARGKTVA